MEFIKMCFSKSFGLMKFKKNWRKKNEHNSTVAKNIFPIDKVKVGKGSYGPLTVKSFGSPNEGLLIGNYCSIAQGVEFLLEGTLL